MITPRLRLKHQTQAQAGTLAGVDLTAVDAVIDPAAGTEHGKTYQRTLSDVGTGRFVMHNTDPNLAAITYGDFVRFDLAGTPDFLMLVEQIDTVAIAPAEEVDEVTTITGRGSLAQWEQAIVLPPNGVSGQPFTETRVFDWGAAELDIDPLTTNWDAAVLLTQVGQGSEGEPPPEFPVRWLGYPLGWSDPTGYWVWSQAAGAGPAMPAGTSYFARDVNIATAGYHAIYSAADNRYELKIDGVLIDAFADEGSQEGYQFTRRADLYLTAGVHRIAMRVTNDSGTELAGFVSALWAVDAERNDDTLVLRADDSWSAIGYPANPPAFTAGHVIRVLLEEAQADGALTGWGRSFTDTHDSDGNPWPVDQQWSFRVGMDLLSVLRQMGASDIDFIADPASLTLHAYAIDGMGVAADAATAVLADLSYLEFQGRA